jgi:dTMP kinase
MEKFSSLCRMKRSHNFAGYLIAIEGIDGAGKTTQAHHVQHVLQSRSLCVIRLKEPTTGHYGQILRDSSNTGRLSLDEEIETFIKDRKEDVETNIRPALEEGKIVILDRYYFSNMAYQGARGADPEDIRQRNEAFAPEPDLLVILDLEPKAGLERIRTRGDRANHFEKTGALRNARKIFLSIRKPYLYCVDATRSVDEIRDLIVQKFSTIVEQRVAHSKATVESNADDALK